MDAQKKLLSVDEKIARKIERHKNFCKSCKKYGWILELLLQLIISSITSVLLTLKIMNVL